MAVASAQGFVGGTNASPTVALHPQGLTERGGGCPSLATAHTLTADSAECLKISSPGSAISQLLPTTNVKAGKRFTLIVTGATETNYVALQSSGGNEIDRIGGDGVIEVVALVDSPTTAAHWRVVNLNEKASFSLTATGANNGAISAIAHRNGDAASKKGTLRFSQATGTMAATGAINASGLPARFQTGAGPQDCLVALVSGNINLVGSGRIYDTNSISFTLLPITNFASSNNYVGNSTGYGSPTAYIIS